MGPAAGEHHLGAGGTASEREGAGHSAAARGNGIMRRANVKKKLRRKKSKRNLDLSSSIQYKKLFYQMFFFKLASA